MKLTSIPLVGLRTEYLTRRLSLHVWGSQRSKQFYFIYKDEIIHAVHRTQNSDPVSAGLLDREKS